METQYRFASQGPLDHSVLTTWTLLFRRLEERSKHAAKLLILWGFLDNRDIWYELFTSALNLKVASELPSWVAIFLDAPCTSLMVFSSIGRQYGRNGLASVCISCVVCTQVYDCRLYTCTKASFTALRSYTLLTLGDYPKVPYNKDDLSLERAYYSMGNLYHDQDKLGEAENMYVRAFAGYEKALGPEHTSTMDTVLCLGNLYKYQGKLREAEDMYGRVLAGYEKALGPEHSSTLTAVHNLGNLYKRQGKLREAEVMYMRALVGYEKALGSEHSNTVEAQSSLTNLKDTPIPKKRQGILRLFKKIKP